MKHTEKIYISIFLICLSVIFGCDLFTSGSSIKGNLVDAISGEPIKGFKIVATTKTDIEEELSGSNLETMTDDKGEFIIKGVLPNKKYKITPSRDGYLSDTYYIDSPNKGETRIIDKTIYVVFDVPGTGLFIADRKKQKRIMIPKKHEWYLDFTANSVPIYDINDTMITFIHHPASADIEEIDRLYILATPKQSSNNISFAFSNDIRKSSKAIRMTSRRISPNLQVLDAVIPPAQQITYYAAYAGSYTRKTYVFGILDMNNLPAEFSSIVSTGNTLMDQGKYELAIQCYKRALEQDPKNVDVIVDIGACHYALGLSQDAISDFKNALEYDPHNQLAMLNLAQSYYSIGETDQAIDWCNRLLAENPAPNLRPQVEKLIQLASPRLSAKDTEKYNATSDDFLGYWFILAESKRKVGVIRVEMLGNGFTIHAATYDIQGRANSSTYNGPGEYHDGVIHWKIQRSWLEDVGKEYMSGEQEREFYSKGEPSEASAEVTLQLVENGQLLDVRLFDAPWLTGSRK